MNVNWCTGCKCVLANEEVVNGVCERCGSEVVHKVKSQWMLKITAYCPFRETTNKWLAIPRAKSVKVYVGLGGYRAGISKREAKLGADAEWGTSRTNLKRQLLYLRSQNGCGGFMLFSYST